MTGIDFTFLVTALPKGRPRFNRFGRAFTPKKTRDFERDLKSVAREQYLGQPLKTALEVDIEFALPRPKTARRALPSVRPDLDNLAKAVCDALEGVAWVNDWQICKMLLQKTYAAKGCPPAIYVVVREAGCATDGP